MMYSFWNYPNDFAYVRHWWPVTSAGLWTVFSVRLETRRGAYLVCVTCNCIHNYSNFTKLLDTQWRYGIPDRCEFLENPCVELATFKMSSRALCWSKYPVCVIVQVNIIRFIKYKMIAHTLKMYIPSFGQI